MQTSKIVIVGAGQAGAWAARTLRNQGYEGAIHLVGSETVTPYERPPLSKGFILGNIAQSELEIMQETELEQLQITAHFGTEAIAINRSQKKLALSSGEALPYDKLLLTTGGRATLPPITGLDVTGVFTLRNIVDAQAIRDQLHNSPQQQVAIVGGGWIGLELAATCNQLGHKVHLLEAGERLCHRSLDTGVAIRLEELHLSKGNKVKYQTLLQSIQKTSSGDLLLRFLDGSSMMVQTVLLATGLKANDELAVAAGLKTANGVQVNSLSQSSDPDVYAAGDVAVLPCFYAPEGRRHESWQNAQDQGVAVAKSMLGHTLAYQPTPMLWSEQFDVVLQVYGYIHAAEQIVERIISPQSSLYFYLTKDNRVIGVIGWSAGRDYRFARQLVDLQMNVSTDRLKSNTEPLMKIIKERST